ncbi:MAG: lysine--tRNA ligase [Nanoarchaeota archaeon]
MSKLSQLKQDRLRNLEALKEAGMEPYPYSFPIDTSLSSLKNKYDSKLKDHEQTEDFYHVAGRIMLLRDMGGLAFATIQDEDSKFQIAFMKKQLGDKYKLLKYFDIGDIIGVYGKIFKTKKGELSILVEDFNLLTKCFVELGDKYHGVKDIEIKYRNRSLDMVMNPDSKSILKKRFLITQKIREFMIKEGFLEIETPITQTNYGGAAAKPFTTHHNELDLDLFLRVSPEQSLKRVLCGGMEAVFEINKNFRNESIDRTHNPEFTMMEAYKAYVDYEHMMSLTERLVEFVALEVVGTTKLEFRGKKIDVKAPWKRVPVKKALEKATGWKLDKMSDKELFTEVKKIGGEMYHKTRGEAILLLFEEYGEPTATQPTHFIDYPKESTVLCKKHRKDGSLIERFESFVGGMEICNAYSELNDALLQRGLFEEQVKHAEKGNEETWGTIDEEFLEALELGMPPAGGLGIGIDRLVMILLNQDSIRDIIYFPTMKPKVEETKKEEKVSDKKKK